MNISIIAQLQQAVPPPGMIPGNSLRSAWQSPSNIAIVKYWGKKDGQYPISPSLSMTLQEAFTKTEVSVLPGEDQPGLVSVNGEQDHPFLPKMRYLLKVMGEKIPALQNVSLAAVTRNSFPHSTGIASSASGISAFALCLLDLACRIHGLQADRDEFLNLASGFARTGSGSACRSLYGGFTVWGETPLVSGASDEYAIPLQTDVHPEMTGLRDAILVISTNPKELPSTGGHRLMAGHPFLNGRISQAHENLSDALDALAANDIEKLGDVAEREALTLHALIMSANPGTLLLKPTTVEVLHRVRSARKTGIPLFFTLDAGANVHLLYPGVAAPAVETFIKDSLQPLCENGLVIFDHCGSGPGMVNDLQPRS